MNNLASGVFKVHSALEVVRSVRERLLSGNTSSREQRANFAPYRKSSTSRKGGKTKQWCIKMYCLADRNVVLIEAGLGPEDHLCTSVFKLDDHSVHLSKAQRWWGFWTFTLYPQHQGFRSYLCVYCTKFPPPEGCSGTGRVYLRPIQKDLYVCIDVDVVPQCVVSNIHAIHSALPCNALLISWTLKFYCKCFVGRRKKRVCIVRKKWTWRCSVNMLNGVGGKGIEQCAEPPTRPSNIQYSWATFSLFNIGSPYFWLEILTKGNRVSILE